MGGGGGGRAPSGPSPAQVAAAQVRAQAAEKIRIDNERAARADQFLSDNAITDQFRSDILSQSNAAAANQIKLLGTQSGGTLQDIRQRNAARGLGTSSSGDTLSDEANKFTQASRDDIFTQARGRSDSRIADQQRFLDNTASDIRGGRDIVSAQNAFRNDIVSANSAFEKALSSAATGNQRNAAFQGFENDRRAAASRFNESVNQFQQAGVNASIVTGGGGKDEDEGTGQVGGGFTGGLQ